MLLKCLYVGQVIAYYDYQKSTIRHIQCPLQIPEVNPTKRCTYCKNYREKVLRSGLNRLLKQQGQNENRSEISSHTNYRYSRKYKGCTAYAMLLDLVDVRSGIYISGWID